MGQENLRKYVEMMKNMKEYVENMEEYEEVCRYIGFRTAHIGSGTWKNSELHPRFWNWEKFRGALPSYSLWDLEEKILISFLYMGLRTWKNSELRLHVVSGI